MALTLTQKNDIAALDIKAKQILQHGSEEALLMSPYYKIDKKILWIHHQRMN